MKDYQNKYELNKNKYFELMNNFKELIELNEWNIFYESVIMCYHLLSDNKIEKYLFEHEYEPNL